ncbi:MAG: hypothetical protein KBS41_01755, partial [Oscillospiraceae bacterium]|nr:hypothetical protein [Candidatus Equicaccousia limihippi]
ALPFDLLKNHPLYSRYDRITLRNGFYPKGVVSADGVSDAQNLVTGGGGATFEKGGVAVFDMGEGSSSGYTYFAVRKHSGKCALRFSFANSKKHILDQKHGRNGDFLRNTCDYLGQRLPVLPANPDRFERYEINHDGEYFFSLLQGQQKYVRIELEEGESVTVDFFCMKNLDACDHTDYNGYFICSNDDINQMVSASNYTCKIAAIPASYQVIDGFSYVLPRYIENGEKLLPLDRLFYGGTLSFKLRFLNNCDRFTFCLWGKTSGFTCTLFRNGKFTVTSNKKEIAATEFMPLESNTDYGIEITKSKNIFTFTLEGKSFEICAQKAFCFGITVENDRLYALKDIKLNRRHIAAKDFLCRGYGAYLADGGMRDRLLWTGDLWFASRTVYYSGNAEIMRDSLYMMAENQCDNGYIDASPYPITLKARKNQTGPFPSAEFSAWFAPILYEYYLYTADKRTAKELYDTSKRNCEHLLTLITNEGLFKTPESLSKGIKNLSLNDGGIITYTNILVWYALDCHCKLSDLLLNDCTAISSAAQKLKAAIMRNLYDINTLSFTESFENRTPDLFANAFGVVCGFCDKQTSQNLPLDNNAMAKIKATEWRALLMLDRDAKLLHSLYAGATEMNYVNALRDDDLPKTVGECMHYPTEKASGGNWNDKSHPDACLSDVFVSLLGLYPKKAGFEEYVIKPHPLNLKNIMCEIPVIKDSISAFMHIEDGTFALKVTTAKNRKANLYLPLFCKEVTVNGVAVTPQNTDEQYAYYGNFACCDIDITAKLCEEYNEYIKGFEIDNEQNANSLNYSIQKEGDTLSAVFEKPEKVASLTLRTAAGTTVTVTATAGDKVVFEAKDIKSEQPDITVSLLTAIGLCETDKIDITANGDIEIITIS